MQFVYLDLFIIHKRIFVKTPTLEVSFDIFESYDWNTDLLLF